MLEKNACPLCGSRTQRQHPHDEELLVCVGCGETLYPTELVRLTTRRTAVEYNRRNGHDDSYR